MDDFLRSFTRRFIPSLFSTALVFFCVLSCSQKSNAVATLADTINGCTFGGNTWETVNKSAQLGMASVTHNSNVKSRITKKTIRYNCEGSARFRSETNTIDVRLCHFKGEPQPGSYSILMVHENCHSVGQTDELYSKFNFSCKGISPYARSKQKNNHEEFAEACTAFLVAPDRIKSGCTDPEGVFAFFKQHAFSGPAKICQGSGAVNIGQDNNQFGSRDDHLLGKSRSNPGGGGIDLETIATIGMVGFMMSTMNAEDKKKDEEKKSICETNPSDPSCPSTDQCSDASYAESYPSECQSVAVGTQEDTSVRTVNANRDVTGLNASLMATNNDIAATSTGTQQQKASAFWDGFFENSDDDIFEKTDAEEAASNTDEQNSNNDSTDTSARIRRAPARVKNSKQKAAAAPLYGPGGLSQLKGPTQWSKISERYSEVQHRWAREDFKTGFSAAN